MAARAARVRLGRLERPALTGVLVREVVNFSSYWRSATFSSTVEPTIYLLAFGFGFGSLVSTVGGYDYVEFVGYLLDHYGDELPERDVGLLELARRLHLARLEELPRQMQRAFDRKRAQDEARAAWLADEAAFDPAAPQAD